MNPVTCLPAIHVCARVGMWRGQRGIVLRWTQVHPPPARVDVMLESGRRVSFPMAVLALEDLTGTIEVLVWPNTFQKSKHLLDSDSPVLVTGRCETDSNGESRILAAAIRSFDSLWDEMVQKARIAIPVSRLNPQSIADLAATFEKYPGQCLVEFELLHDDCSIRLVPSQDVKISPNPTFVRSVEKIFGGKSVTLYT